jgi:glycosyltransferase EpsE
MSNPLVSIIIPIYNCEKYVEESLNSVIDQTFKDYQILIYNDSSTDNAESVIISFLNKYVKPDKWQYINYNRRGCFGARSALINTSKSKYILLQDADDISMPDRLQKQVDILEDNKNIWCVGSTALKIDENGKNIGEMDYPPESHEEILKMIIQKCMNPIIDPSTMFRKDVFDKLGGYSLNQDRYLVDDFDLWLRSIIGGFKLYNLQEPLIKYRINSEGNTRKHQKEMIKQHMVVWREFKLRYNIKGKNL